MDLFISVPSIPSLEALKNVSNMIFEEIPVNVAELRNRNPLRLKLLWLSHLHTMEHWKIKPGRISKQHYLLVSTSLINWKVNKNYRIAYATSKNLQKSPELIRTIDISENIWDIIYACGDKKFEFESVLFSIQSRNFQCFFTGQNIFCLFLAEIVLFKALYFDTPAF